jgi:hypothetical protein
LEKPKGKSRRHYLGKDGPGILDSLALIEQGWYYYQALFTGVRMPSYKRVFLLAPMPDVGDMKLTTSWSKSTKLKAVKHLALYKSHTGSVESPL